MKSTMNVITYWSSRLRDVPDNQEIFVHPETDQSVIFDILEYANDVKDADAAKWV